LWQTQGGGECSSPCKQDGDCPSGFACVSGTLWDADAGSVGGCLPRCSNSQPCPAFQCAARSDVSGSSVTVCDPHMPGGAACRGGGDCLSGRCGSQQTCITGGGLPNGSTCSLPSDCASGNCQGTCRGTGQIGDNCANSYDCAVGTCCSSGLCC
jgi:hypothetical protein